MLLRFDQSPLPEPVLGMVVKKGDGTTVIIDPAAVRGAYEQGDLHRLTCLLNALAERLDSPVHPSLRVVGDEGLGNAP